MQRNPVRIQSQNNPERGFNELFREKFLKGGVTFIFLALITIPYFLHPGQDPSYGIEPVHDEAAFHLNAKDAVSFGWEALKENRPTYILVPLQFLLALAAFFFFGCSLIVLRLPYIILNAAGNCMLFYALRRRYNNYISMLTTAGFAFYYQRFLFGRTAMAESLTMSLELALLWLLTMPAKKPRAYFWAGFLSVLILCSKLDNGVILLFVAAFVMKDVLTLMRGRGGKSAAAVAGHFALGIVVPLALWALFFYTAGLETVKAEFEYVLKANINVSSPWQPGGLTPFSPALAFRNLSFAWTVFPGLFLAAGICLVPFAVSLAASKKERGDWISWCIICLLLLFAAKITTSIILPSRRLVPCLLAPFLLAAQSAGFLLKNEFAWNGKVRAFIKSANGRSYKARKMIFPALYLVLILCLCYQPDVAGKTMSLIISPSYRIEEEARTLGRLMDPYSRAMFFDGRFAYIALILPNRFIDIPPAPDSDNFYDYESNPALAEKLLKGDRGIRYVFCRPDYSRIIEMVEREFGGRVMCFNVTGYGLLYELPGRQPPR